MATLISLECAWCGKTFQRSAAKVKAKGAKKVYCNAECWLNGKQRAQKDFWSLVEKRGHDECWHWKGGVDSNGYGYFEEKNKHVISHRRAYELVHGTIPKGEGYHGTVIRHSCDTPSCNNPRHLVPGTQMENVTDIVVRRRMRLKLTEDQVQAIRNDTRPYPEIGAEYGISAPTISNIKHRTTWKHVK